MTSLAPGARRFPTRHITIRVPWHDSGWAGSVCARPLENTSRLILPRIGECTLVETCDESGGGLSASHIAKLIDDVLIGGD